MRAFALAAVLSLAAGAALADADPPPPWSGVWQGTLGEQKIEACFGRAGGPSQGSYYYLRHRKLIALETGKTAATWTEGYGDEKKAPVWSLTPSGSDQLGGTWSGSGRSLPIRLTRVPLAKVNDDDVDAPCGNRVFTAPRISPPMVTRAPAVLDGVRYSKLTAHVGAPLDVAIETFALDGATPAVTRLNAALAKPLPERGASAPADYVGCLMWEAASSGDDGEYDDALTPDLITRRWMVTQEVNNTTCGGAHPNVGVDWRVWDLTTGAGVDAWSWFTADAAVRTSTDPKDPPQVGPKLRKLLIARWPRKDRDCSDAPEGEDYWDVHPTRTGMAFWPQFPHVIFACSEDVVIPYRTLAPLLNVKGRAAVASIVEDLKALPPRAKRKR